jgi:HK97 family phage major capsid protein
MPYNTIITRDTPNTPDPFLPEAYVAEILQDAPKSSAALSLMRKQPMSTKKTRQPVLSALPTAYWVNGDTGMKQTTKPEWDNLELVAEELATIVVIPDAYFDDANIPLWPEIRPLLAEAIGKKIDQATLFGLDKPSTWPTAIYPGTMAAGNTVVAGTGEDLAQDIALLGQELAEDGSSLQAFASVPGFDWRLIGLRDQNGALVYQAGLNDGTPGSIYGRRFLPVENGSWDATEALLIGGEWDKAIIGVRQDITYRIFSEGVISDDDGVVLVNLMQQDAKAMRVVMRVGFTVQEPLNRIAGTGTRYPFATLQAATAGS